MEKVASEQSEQGDESHPPTLDESAISILPPFIRLTLSATLTPIYIAPDNVVCFYPALAKSVNKQSKVVGIRDTVTGSIIVVSGADNPFNVTEHVDDIFCKIHGEPPSAN